VHHSDVDGSSCLKEECAIILTLKDGVGRNVNNEVFWCKDGSFISVEYTTHPIYQKGVLQGSVLVFQDITERKQAELLAQKQRNELNQLARATMLGELSTTLAHELNQPLAAILSNAQAAQRFLLKENCDLNEVREILKDIVADNNRASEVISRLRQMLKENSVEQKVLNVNEMVIDVLKLVQNDLTNRNILIKITLTPQIPSIMGDRVLLQQVLLNLILNACDASIFATSEEKSQLNIYTQANSDTVQVTVTDQGHGIGLDVMERIFEPLFTTKPQGIGLGLSICRNIIKVHKGQLWAENNSDRGASFHFSIPSYSEKSI
jgi:two-component system sensor kinase FixL